MEQKPKILIVEDEANFAILIRNVLIRSGYHAIEPVSTGEEAVEKARLEKPDLVLMDVNLKDEMSGVEAALDIQSFYDIPIIFASGYPPQELLKDIKYVKRSSLISKPFVPDELLLAINLSLQK